MNEIVYRNNHEYFMVDGKKEEDVSMNEIETQTQPLDKMNGKKAKAIFWPDGSEMHAKNFDLIGQYDYHGEYDDFWILQIKDGKEIARHNMKFIETVIWEQ